MFLIAACGAVAIVVWLVLLGGTPDTDYRVFRGLEIVLSVAALGLIATLMGKTANVFAVVIGFLVISALVIPTRDLVRITLIASGSDKSLDHYYGSTGVASNLSNNITDTSQRLISAIEKTMGRQTLLATNVDMIALKAAITSELRRDQLETLLQRVKARGIVELFKAIAEGETEAFLYRHSQNDRLVPDLQFLRYEGLISIAYDDVSTASITELGLNVLRFESGLADEATIITESAVQTLQSPLPSCEAMSMSTLNGADLIELSEAPIRIPVRAGNLPRYVTFRVLGGDVGTYTFGLNSTTGGFDPVMSLTSYDGDAARSNVFSNCLELIYDDDGGGAVDGGSDLDSRIQTPLSQGYYLLGLGTLGGTGVGELVIQKQ